VHQIDSAMLRRIIPALAVSGVLALSLFVSVPSLASNSEVGYGYGNNCGVKGTGYHDHGKVCPNRPFPGKGVTEAPASDTTTPGNSDKATKSISTTVTSSTDEDSSSTGKSHGHGNSKAKGHGRGIGHD
jgi:hypothetical protein